MKKLIFLLLASIMMFTAACEQEQPTKFSAVYDKHTIQEDSNWVEIFDIDTVKTCVGLEVFHGGVFITEKKTLEELLSSTKDLYKNKGWNDINVDSCVVVNRVFDFDFNLNNMVLYFMELNGSARWNRKIYKNEKQKTYIYLLEIQRLNESLNHMNRIYYADRISIQKLPNEYQFKFDTIFKYVDKYE